MPHDHPGFDYWDIDDHDHPFPVGDIEIAPDTEDATQAEADFTLPAKLPGPATVAERYIGLVGLAQFWFALECSPDALGNVTCEAVLRARHLQFFPDHGETGAGPELAIRLTMADMAVGKRCEALAAHGPHCDLLSLSCSVRAGKVHCELYLLHVRKTVQGLLDSRERWKREAERMPQPRLPLPDHDRPVPPPPPKPKPEPIPEGAMTPGRPGGVLAGIVGFFKRLAWGLFG